MSTNVKMDVEKKRGVFHQSIIDKYIKDNTLVEHHISACNYFYDIGLRKTIVDNNPIPL